jgi:hypothetical protein
MTIQFQNEQREYNAYIGGASSIGMGSNLSNKNPKERNKTQKLNGSYPTTRLTCKCGEASLSSRRTAPSTLIKTRSRTCNTWIPQPPWKTWVILKITQYEFRSSLKILSSFLDWTQLPILYFKCSILIIYI